MYSTQPQTSQFEKDIIRIEQSHLLLKGAMTVCPCLSAYLPAAVVGCRIARQHHPRGRYKAVHQQLQARVRERGISQHQVADEIEHCMSDHLCGRAAHGHVWGRQVRMRRLQRVRARARMHARTHAGISLHAPAGAPPFLLSPHTCDAPHSCIPTPVMLPTAVSPGPHSARSRGRAHARMMCCPAARTARWPAGAALHRQSHTHAPQRAGGP